MMPFIVACGIYHMTNLSESFEFVDKGGTIALRS
jgi:hypothetical protein